MISNLEVAQERHAGITFIKTTDKCLLTCYKNDYRYFRYYIKKTTNVKETIWRPVDYCRDVSIITTGVP